MVFPSGWIVSARTVLKVKETIHLSMSTPYSRPISEFLQTDLKWDHHRVYDNNREPKFVFVGLMVALNVVDIHGAPLAEASLTLRPLRHLDLLLANYALTSGGNVAGCQMPTIRFTVPQEASCIPMVSYTVNLHNN